MFSTSNFHRCVLFMAVSLSCGSCTRKPTVQTSVSDLEQAFGTATNAVTIVTAGASVATTDTANDLVKSALSSARANDYAASVIALQEAVRKPGVTAEQVTAVQNAKRILVTD